MCLKVGAGILLGVAGSTATGCVVYVASQHPNEAQLLGTAAFIGCICSADCEKRRADENAGSITDNDLSAPLSTNPSNP